MTRHFTFINDTSNKFWQITTDGTAYTVTFGRIGTAGQSQTKTVDSPDRCQQEADKLIREKTGKGYLESVDGVPVTAAVPTAKKTVEQRANPDREALETILNRYEEIIQNMQTDALLPFLQSIDKRHYPALRQKIKQAKKHWCDYVVLGTELHNGIARDQWGYQGTWDQRLIVSLSALALLSLSELKGVDGIYNLVAGRQAVSVARGILAWAKPPWLADFLLQQTSQGSWSTIPYAQLRELETAGLVNYQPELFARSMALFHDRIFIDDGKSEQDYQPYVDFLTTDTLVLARELPVLFDYPIPVHESFGTIRKKKNPYERVYIWPLVFARLLADGKLDRLWFFEKCLSVQTKDWNINLRAFYRKQVEAANPSPAEWLSLQPVLLPLLAAQHPHVVNWASGILKQISTEPGFQTEEMLDWASAMMMRDDCKTGLKTVLTVFERLLKTQPDHRTTIMHLLADVFAINDLTLQTKATALLAKYGDPTDTNLQATLHTYAGQMLGTVAGDLQSFMHTGNGLLPDVVTDKVDYRYAPKVAIKLVPGHEVQLPDTWNDLLFLIGKFIGSGDPLDGEILMNALLLMPNDTPADFREQLKPYEKKLEKTYFESVTKQFTQAYVLHWLSGIDKPFVVANIGPIQTLHLQLLCLQHLDRKQKVGSKLPLLSLPTHAPHWIDPNTLVERLLTYQRTSETIEPLDLAIAIARMPRENTVKAMGDCQELDLSLNGLLRYCLGEINTLELPGETIINRLLTVFQQKNKHTDLQILWAVAARTVGPETEFLAFADTPLANFPNVVRPFAARYEIGERFNEWKDYQTGEMKRYTWRELTFALTDSKKPPATLLYSNDLVKTNGKEYTYYDLTATDASFWYSLIPQQPEALFTFVAKYGCNVSEVELSLNQSLTLMLQSGFQFRAMSMLVLACGLLGNRRETRALAAEVLIHHFGEQTLDVVPLAEQVGWLLANNYAPVQRLTDALNLVRDVSPLHNKALTMFLDGLFAQLMPLTEPPKNTRKLLEIYLDLLVKLAEPPSQQTTLALTNWQKTASLKKLCTDILKLS